MTANAYVLIETSEYNLPEPAITVFGTYQEAREALEKNYEETYNQAVPDDLKGNIDSDFSRLGGNDNTAFIDFDGNDNRIGFSIRKISIRL